MALCASLLFFAGIPLICGDELYQEGFYDYSILPGGYLDPRNQPNVPISTDTNRYSDGFSGAAAPDTTSPHFPYYIGANANVSDRYLRYTGYVESAAEQGISPFGAGDEVREAARRKITEQEGFETLPAPNKTFTVYAPIKWNPSDFAIQEGETYSVEVMGNQTGM